jgi:hypothetical protein
MNVAIAMACIATLLALAGVVIQVGVLFAAAALLRPSLVHARHGARLNLQRANQCKQTHRNTAQHPPKVG